MVSLVNFVKLFVVFFLLTIRNETNAILSTPKEEIFLSLNQTQSLQLKLTKPNNYDQLTVVIQHEDILDVKPKFFQNIKNESNVVITVHAVLAGHSNIKFFNNQTNAFLETSVIEISVYKKQYLNTISKLFGWIYFFAWSASFYPQIIKNYQRKSVVGLHFDFVALNIVGFFLYSIYNIGLYSITSLKDEYSKRHSRSVNPVQIHDILFSVHATLVTLVTICQCVIYESDQQRVSNFNSAFMVVAGSFLSVCFMVSLNGAMHWLDFFYVCSYIKLIITIIKYIPQANMNYRRKSTSGWSIGNIFLDLTGGIFSMIQMMILAFNYDDWSSIFGDFTKFGLGLVSLSFDLFFVFQHYILYRQIDVQTSECTKTFLDCQKVIEKFK